jgi:hypothetical protein
VRFPLFFQSALRRSDDAVIETPSGLDLGLVFGLSLALRVTILTLAAWNRPLSGDEFGYVLWARRFGDLWMSSNFYLPGWPACLSLITRFTDSTGALRLLAVLLNAVNSTLICALGSARFGRRTGLVAGGLHALNPETIFFSVSLHAETLLETCYLAAALVLFARRGALRRPSAWAAAGLVVGVAGLVKHFAVLFAGALMAVLLRFGPRRAAAPFLILAALPLFLYSTYFARQGGDPLFYLNAPIFNLRVWRNIQPSGRPPESTLHSWIGLRGGGFQPLSRPFRRAWWRLEAFWAPGFLPADFPRGQGPAGRGLHYGAFGGAALALAAVVLAGLYGLCLAPPGPFSTFAGALVALYTATTLVMATSPRYHRPLFFVLLLYAGAAMVSKPALSENRRRVALFFVLALIFIALLADHLAIRFHQGAFS